MTTLIKSGNTYHNLLVNIKYNNSVFVSLNHSDSLYKITPSCNYLFEYEYGDLLGDTFRISNQLQAMCLF